MAVTLTNLNDILIGQNALDAFVAQLSPFRAFSTSYDVTAAQRGQTITVPLLANITATTAENSYESADSGSMSGIDLSMTNYRKASVGIKDSQFYGSSVADITRFSKQLSAGVATSISTLLYGAITSGNYATAVTGVTASSFGIAGCRSARLALSNNRAPVEDRCLVLNPTAYGSVLSDLSEAQKYGGTEAIRDAGPLKVYGMNVYEDVNLPAGLIGFAAVPSAMALAVRPLLPQSAVNFIEAKELVDKQTGLALSYRRHYAPATGTHWCTIEALVGFNVGVTAGLVRITA
jgi:hypothetical protein